MKHAANENKVNSVKSKRQTKTSANVVKKTQPAEKSVSAKNLKLQSKKAVTIKVSTKVAPKNRKVQSSDLTKELKATKTVSSKNTSTEVPKTKTVASENAVSKKALTANVKKNKVDFKANLITQISQSVKPKAASKSKLITKKIQTAVKQPTAKTVLDQKNVKSKTLEKVFEAKVSRRKTPIKAERKDILAYAKPAITGKVKSPDKVLVKREIEIPGIEQKISEELKEPKKKAVRAIGNAIFRGEKDSYQFKVYEINETFKEIPAVYIISKRITDKKNRGHHKLICIGQTDSILKDLKTHRKSKCLRSNKANVISILREEDKEKRLQIENDLKAAHSIICNLAQ